MEINKGLYGDGSRSCRLRCETVMCDHYMKCSLYAEGKCRSVTVPLGKKCEFGNVSIEDGGTKQGRNFYVLKEKVKADPLHGKLVYPLDCYIYTVGDKAVLDIPYITIVARDNEKGMYSIREAGLVQKPSVIPVENITGDLLKRLWDYTPINIFGNAVESHRNKAMPLFLMQLKRVLPKVYEDFISAYPECDIAPDYKGKFAYLKTLNHDPSITYRDTNGFCYHFEGEYLVGRSSSCFMPFNGKNVELKIPVDDGMTYKIDDNRQVLEDTKFR